MPTITPQNTANHAHYRCGLGGACRQTARWHRYSCVGTISFVKTKRNRTHETCIPSTQTPKLQTARTLSINLKPMPRTMHAYDYTAKTRLITSTIVAGLAALADKQHDGIDAAKQQSAEYNIFHHGVPLLSESCSIIAQSGS